MSKLQDFCLQITDGEHRSCEEDVNGRHYMLNNQNITEAGIMIKETDRRISDQDFLKIQKRLQLECGDVVIATCGTIGKLQILDSRPDFIFSRSVGIVKCDRKKLLPEFLRYYLMQSVVQKRLKMLVSGMPGHICVQDLKNFEVSIPDIAVQKQIAEKLDPVEKKIRNNFQIIKEVHETAEDLCRYWSSLEFKNGTVGELIQLMDGKTCGCSEVGAYPVYASGGIIKYVDRYMSAGLALIIPRKGSLNHIQYASGPFWASDTVFYAKELVPNAATYLYYILQNYDLWKKNTGSAIPSLTKEAVYSIKVPMLSKDNLFKFARAAKTLLKIEMQAQKENQQLMILRKDLLEVLMNDMVRN